MSLFSSSFLGPFWVHISSFWAHFESIFSHFWSIFRPFWAHFEFKYESILNSFWAHFELIFGMYQISQERRLWIIFEMEMTVSGVVAWNLIRLCYFTQLHQGWPQMSPFKNKHFYCILSCFALNCCWCSSIKDFGYPNDISRILPWTPGNLEHLFTSLSIQQKIRQNATSSEFFWIHWFSMYEQTLHSELN